MSEAPLWQAVVCGCAGGTGATLVGHPLETMKARVQMGLPSWPGLRGLYVGLAAPILGNAPFWACYFASYRAAQRHVAPYFGDDTAAAQLAVGAVAGAASAVALTPIDAVKVTAQVDQVSTAAAFRRLRERRELFRALLPTVVRMIPSTAVRSFCVRHLFSRDINLPQVFFYAHDAASRRGWSPFLAGGLAGVAEWSFILPAYCWCL